MDRGGARLAPPGDRLGGTACPALWAWVDAGDPGFRRTEAFGTRADAANVTSDGETVTVTVTVIMPSFDPERPFSAFVWDGRGPVREVPQGPVPSGAPPEAGAEAWVGRHAHDLLRASHWRGPLLALLGKEGFAALHGAMASPRP